ncbi:peptidase associated/transthyretin-like domain-containing protein [Olleya marilimosa]|uniref:Carboxypeptidase-like regulatory domain-containing protein n=1 Tax=Olleya marilimosa TaxID=272164 RepID=A0ABR8LQV1_9FLAO|nr:hypothetical protein [Olleya marilimosa]MBD3862607.1 hypothetical protein [Olleya marilimosa]MBD3890105.1 hypothetical protein [Olleya marilimosa]
MKKINLFLCFILFVSVQMICAQTVELKGTITAEDDIESIHILNKTSLTNATSSKDGSFTIKAKLNDTIIFSAVQYTLLTKVVSQEDITSKTIAVTLKLQTNQLDEVFLKRSLSGNLEDDLLLLEAKPVINFYDVGIPGYQGKQKTSAERVLHEATTGGGLIPLNPLLNGISGRTKKLKEIVRLENDDALLVRLKNDLKEDFFKDNPLDQKHHTDFFYFVQEDPDFRSVCSKSNLDALAFFKKKLDQYNTNLVTKQ